MKQNQVKQTHEYLDEIRENLRKVQSKGTVTETENALFGMIDGLAGMLHRTNERVTELERQVAEVKRVSHTHTTTTHA